MELNELKQAWQNMEQELQAQKRISAKLLAERTSSGLEASLRPLFRWQVVQIVIGVCLSALAGQFWVARADQTSLLVAGIIVHIYAIALIINGARVLMRFKEIDLSASVTTLQRRVARLEQTYVRSGWILGLPWWVLWIPVALMLLEMIGIDISRVPASSWMPGSIAFGILGMLLTVIGFQWARRSTRPGVRERVERMASGVNIDKAKRLLADVERFEQES
mgnify:CR=1 FL=1